MGVWMVYRSSGRCFYLFFNRFDVGGNSETEWTPAVVVPRIRSRALWPDVSFSDRRVKLADLTGDGLVDIALVHLGQPTIGLTLATDAGVLEEH